MSVFSFLGNAAKTVGHDVGTVAHGNSNPGGGVFGFLANATKTAFPQTTHPQTNPNSHPISLAPNPNNFGPALSQAQGIARTVPETAQTIIHPFSQSTYTPGSPVEQAAFGSTPIQNIQAKVATNYQDHPGLNPVLRVGLAGAEGVASAAQDAPVFGFLAKEAGAGAKTISAIDKSISTKFPATQNLNVGKLGLSTQESNPGKLAQDLVNATTPKDAFQTLTKSGVDELTARKIAPAVAQTKDPNIIKNIIDNAHKPPALPQAPIQDITPVKPLESIAPEGQGTNEAINSHLQTIRNAESTGPELQQAIKGLQQTHEMRSTQELSDQAKQTVEKDYTGSLTKTLTNDNPSDKDVAVAAHLVTKAQQDAAVAKAAGDMATHDSKIAEAVTIAEKTDLTLREAGRTAQAGSIIGRLSPEGVLQYATRKLRQVRELNPKNIDRENNTAQQLKDTVESAKPNLDKKTISGIVDEATKAANAPSTGEQIASKVESAAAPSKPKPVDQLVNEITKKVKQQYLEPKVTTRKAPLDIIKEVMGRNEEAQKAYPEAQQILREKFAGDEKMSGALDKFFGSKLGTPVANTTFERAIGDQLKANNLKIPDIIKQSIKNQHYSVDQITSDLTKEGFDQKSATTVATEVSNRLTSKIAEAKRTALENLAKDVKPRNQATVLEKINKFSNLGALSNEDYLHLARAKLNLPHLTTETAGKIHDLSQNLQDLPEGGDKYAAIRQIQHLIQDEIPKSKWDIAKQLIGLPRTVLATGDFSFGAKQGIVYATSHPLKFAEAWPKQFAYFKQAFGGNDSEAYDAMMADIRNHPRYNDLEKYVGLQEPTGHSTALRQEQFLSSDLAEKIPAIGRLVRASNYAYTGLGNYLKANQFYGMVEHLDYGNVPLTEDMGNKLGEAINTSLGRGGKKGGFVEKHGGFLSTALFAPRLVASRLNVMNPAYYIRLDGPARQEALRGLLGMSAFATGILGLAKLAGADVSIDSRSSDFGKVKLGDTRLDPLAGFSQYIRLGTQITTGQKINSTTGAQTEAGKGFAGSRLDIASNFIQGKENPSVSFVTTMLKGKDINGNSLYSFKGASGQVIQRFIPLLAQDINDLQSHPNAVNGSVPGKIGAATAGLFGVGLQTYGAQDEPIAPKQQAYIQQLQQQGADKPTIQANTQFFQNLKTSSGTRSQVSNDITKALKAGDTPKAQQLAEQYNKELSAGMTKWAQQYGEQYGNSDLQQAYDHQKINLSPESIQSRIKALNSTKPF